MLDSYSIVNVPQLSHKNALKQHCHLEVVPHLSSLHRINFRSSFEINLVVDTLGQAVSKVRIATPANTLVSKVPAYSSRSHIYRFKVVLIRRGLHRR